MILAYIKAAVGVALLLVGWVAVERAWSRVFSPGNSHGRGPEGPNSLDRDRRQAEVQTLINACRGCLVCTRRCHRPEPDRGHHSSNAAMNTSR